MFTLAATRCSKLLERNDKCFFKSHFGTILTSVLALFMGLVMALTVILINGLPMNWPTIFELWGEIFFIVFVCSLFIPYNAWGDWLAGLFHLQEGTLGFKLVQGIIPSVVLNTANTLICTGASIFYNPAIPQAARMSAFVAGCEKAWLPCFIVSYIASYVAVWLGETVAKRYVK